MEINDPNGFANGDAMNSDPSINSGTSGLRTVKSPILLPFGDPAPGGDETVSAAYCAGEQPTRPAPTEGLIVVPSGRATTAVRTAAGFRRLGLSNPSLPTSRSKSNPLGEDARGLATKAWAVVSKRIAPQPSSVSPPPSSGWANVR